MSANAARLCAGMNGQADMPRKAVLEMQRANEMFQVKIMAARHTSDIQRDTNIFELRELIMELTEH